MSEGMRPPRTTHARHKHEHHAEHSYLRGMPPPPVYSPPPPRTQFALFRALHPRLVRFAPTVVLIGIVSAVLVGHGFWSHSTLNATDDFASTSGAKLFNVPSTIAENFPVTADESSPGDNAPVAVTVNVPGGSTTTVLGNTTGSLSFTGYVSRPAASVTLPSQRIQMVPARRDDTVDTIAARTGVSAKALMYANTISDPAQTLTVGQVLRVPPVGTMLHRVKESDTLESIAKAYGVSVDEITGYKGNNVQQSGDLVPGTFLIIPTVNLPMRDKVVFYQVHDGDSLFKITSFYNLSDPQTLQWANNLPSANLVLPGQIIAVPPVDGVIHVVEAIDTQRTTDDAITQIAKNFACTAVPCTETPSDERVNALAAAIFAFGPNHLTHGGKLIEGQEIVIPNGKPFVEPPPVIIPRTVVIDNPGPTTATTSGNSVSTNNGSSVTAVTTTRRTTTATTGSGTRTTTTITTNDNYGGGGGGVAGVASRFLGQYRQANGVPWSGYCEKFVGDVAVAAGVGHNRYPTAISDAYSGKLYSGNAPAGALVFFDQSWSWAGHVGISMGDGTMVSALGGGVVRTAYAGSSGYIGWRPFP